MSEGGTRHDGKRHCADRADGQRVEGCYRREHARKPIEAEQQQTKGEPAVADMQDQQQWLGAGL